MRDIRHRVSVISDYVSPPGNRFHNIYEPRFDGVRTYLCVTGTEDTQALINSYAPYCDLEYMLNRLSVGDTSHANPRTPLYGDFSAMPNNLIDSINYLRNAESRFLRLPADVRSGYGNDWMRWLVDTATRPTATTPTPDPTATDKGE